MNTYPLPNGELITHPQLVANLAKPGAAILETLTPEKADAWHMASCIPGEVGELFGPVVDHIELGCDLDFENVVEELGDIEFYVQGLRAIYGITYGETEGAFPLQPKTALFALPGAAAEVFDVAKRWIIYNKPFDRDAMVVALTNLDTCLGAVNFLFNIDRDDVLGGNVMKLGTRYKGGYSDKAAQDRADKAGTVH